MDSRFELDWPCKSIARVDGKTPRQLKKPRDRFCASENPRAHDHAFREDIEIFQNLVKG
jgi:hypothetical protein